MSLSQWQQEFKKSILGKKPKDRMVIYQNAISRRFKESLSSDFSLLKEQMGDKKFNKLIEDYLKKHPSRYASLAQVGKNLPVFMKTQKYKKAEVELARLDWAMFEFSLYKQKSWPEVKGFSELTKELLDSAVLVLNPQHSFNKSLSTLIFRIPDKNSGLIYFEKMENLEKRFYRWLLAKKSLKDMINLAHKKKISPEKLFALASRWAQKKIVLGF